MPNGLSAEVRITLRKGIQNEQRNINYTLRTGSSCTTERKSSRPNWGYLCTALHCHFPIPIPCPIPCPIPGPIPNSTTATLTTIPQRAACVFSQCDCHMNCMLPPLAHFVCSNCSRQLLEEEEQEEAWNERDECIAKRRSIFTITRHLMQVGITMDEATQRIAAGELHQNGSTSA